MKKVQAISSIIMFIALLIMVINVFFIPLSDLIVRIVGTIMLICIFLVTYSTVHLRNASKN